MGVPLIAAGLAPILRVASGGKNDHFQDKPIYDVLPLAVDSHSFDNSATAPGAVAGYSGSPEQ
jgi:hypothetical protein